LPDEPLFNVPCFRSCIAFSTFFDAFFPYFDAMRNLRIRATGNVQVVRPNAMQKRRKQKAESRNAPLRDAHRIA
jgi:hypothetical protein